MDDKLPPLQGQGAEIRKPEEQQARPSGFDQAADALRDELFRGHLHLKPVVTPLLHDVAQLPPLGFKNDETKTQLKVVSNLYTLNTTLDYQNRDFTVQGRFTPNAGWHRPFAHPAYSLAAETTDKSTLFRVSSPDGSAPSLRFQHSRDGLGLTYNRDVTCNTLSVTAGTDSVRFGLGHDFRKQHATVGLSGQLAPYTNFGVGASLGQHNYDVNFYLKIGDR